jgi:hypothetical protein
VNWFRKSPTSERHSTSDRACLEARGEANRRLGADQTFIEGFVISFLYHEVGSAFDIGTPDTRWLRGLEISEKERSEAIETASTAYWKCFVTTVSDAPDFQYLFTELVDAQKYTDETFEALTDQQRREFAVNLWRGARTKGIRVRDVGKDT